MENTKPIKTDKTKWIWFGALMLFTAGPFAAIAIANAVSPTTSLEQLELAYKNAAQLHETSITQEVMAAKNECNALAVLASAKLLAANNGQLKEVDKEDLAKKASVQCFQEVK